MIRKPNSFTKYHTSVRIFSAAALAAILGATASVAHADPITFSLVQASSQINLTANGELLGGALTAEEQFPGSPTKYSGTIDTHLTQQFIGFPGGTTATADVLRGAFSIPRGVSPNIDGGAGTAAANYGMTLSAPVGYELPPIPVGDLGEIVLTLSSVNIDLALRDVQVGLSAPNLPLTTLPLPQNFDASQTNLVFTGNADVNVAAVFNAGNYLFALGVAAVIQGVLDGQAGLEGVTVNVPLLSPNVEVGFGGRFAIPETVLPNSMADPATLAHIGGSPGQYELTVPIETSLTPDLGGLEDLIMLNLGLNGQLVARAGYVEVAVPEPSSVILALSAAAGLGLAALRRRRRS